MISFGQHLIESMQINASIKAYRSLSHDAQYALDKWESSMWIGGPLEDHYKANDAVWQEIQKAFLPVRAAIPGNSIKLYRGIRNKPISNWESKVLESWTDDPRVAGHFAGRRQALGNWNTVYREKIPTDEEINKAVALFHRTGYTKWRNVRYILNKSAPQYYNMYDRYGEFITDGDVLRMKQDFERERQEMIDHRNEVFARGQVLEKVIPKDQIVWLTNNLKSKEYIVVIRK